MRNPGGGAVADETAARRAGEFVRRAVREFLGLPTLVIAAFLAFAVLTYALDIRQPAWVRPARELLVAHAFSDARATSDLLGAIAGSIITVTSITISLLLLALQQSAASMSHAIFDQFLRRRVNQLYFGFFIGLALFALVTLATVNEPFNPVLGAATAFLLTVLALYLLLLLLYTTVNQMRPAEIVEAIHDQTLAGRECQLDLVARTLRKPSPYAGQRSPVAARAHGYVTAIDLEGIAGAARRNGGIEVVLRVSIGTFVALGDPLAELAGPAREVEEAVVRGIRLERQRDVGEDPAYGIEQLEAIAWTSISTSKQNPSPGLLAIRALRDLLARWSAAVPAVAEPVPVVYHDPVFAKLLAALESLAVVASESMQHQNFIEVVRAIAQTFPRIPEVHRARASDVALRILPALGDFVLTEPLDDALRELGSALAEGGYADVAAAVRESRAGLARSVGRLHSRATRAQA